MYEPVRPVVLNADGSVALEEEIEAIAQSIRDRFELRRPSDEELSDAWQRMQARRKAMGEKAWEKMLRDQFVEATVYDMTHPCPLEAITGTISAKK